VRRLDLECFDVREDMPDLPGPNAEHAKRIYQFIHGLGDDDLLIAQCEAGVGRSAAVAAAVAEWYGDIGVAGAIIGAGTYNRKLHKLLLTEFGLLSRIEPIVAMAVRVKYPINRLQAFAHSLRQQRYTNWKCVFVSDGAFDWDGYTQSGVRGGQFTVLETTERRGLWGHPYRQLGIDTCLAMGADYVGLANDDNYLTPGYLEQMVFALQTNDADFAICQMLHAYSGWGVVAAEPRAGCADVGNWLAAADLIRQVQWEGTDFLADGRFVERLAAKARRIVKVERPLVCKN
jgi:hypothetical protein